MNIETCCEMRRFIVKHITPLSLNDKYTIAQIRMFRECDFKQRNNSAYIMLYCLYSDYLLILMKSNSMLFLNLHRVPNENTNLNIQIKEDPKFNEEVENYFSKDHQII